MKRALLFFAWLFAAFALVIATVEVCGIVFVGPTDNEREAPYLEFNARRGWASRPNASGIFENPRYGYKARVSFDSEGIRKTGNSVLPRYDATLLVVGDSTSLGMEVDDDKAYPARLEKMFLDQGKRVRVINGGVRAYGADQAYLYLEELNRRYHPDLVLFMAGPYGLWQLSTVKNWYRAYSKPAFALEGDGLKLLNSPVGHYEEEEFSYVNYTPRGFELVRSSFKPSGIRRWLRNHLFLYSKLEEIYYTRVDPGAFRPPPEDRKYRVEVMRRLLEKMKTVAPRLLVTGFTMHDPADVPDYDVFRDLAAREKIEFVDIRPSFREGVNYKFPIDGHWTEAGHAQAAESLFPALAKKMGLSKRP